VLSGKRTKVNFLQHSHIAYTLTVTRWQQPGLTFPPYPTCFSYAYTQVACKEAWTARKEEITPDSM